MPRLVPPNEVYYDATVLTSVKHFRRRGAQSNHALCGEPLVPFGKFRRAALGVPVECGACMVEQAREIMYEAHRRQFDMDGSEHSQHVEAVVEAVRLGGGDDLAVAAAYLHDVIEDSAWDAALLREAAFPQSVVATVVLLSKEEGEERDLYIEEIATTPGPEGERARFVKLKDLRHNLQRSARTHGQVERARRYAGEIERIGGVVDHAAA